MANGILAQYGLNLDEEQILKEQKLEQQARALGMAQGMGSRPGEQTAANIGALLGARIAKPMGMTEDQARRVQITEQTEARMKEWLAANKAANFRDRSRQYRRFLSEQAFENGLPDVGAQVAAELDAEEQMQMRKDIELEAAGIDLAKLRAGKPYFEQEAADAAIQSREAAIEAQTGRSKTLYTKGSDMPRSGYIDPKDLTAYIEGEAYPLGTYSRVPYVKGKGAGKGLGNDGVGVYERSQIRAAFRSTTGLIRQANGLYDMLDEIASSGSIEELGAAGGVLNWTNRFADNATAIGRALAEAAGVPFNSSGKLEMTNEDGTVREVALNTPQGKAAVANRYGGAIDQYIQASGIATKGQNAAQLRAKFIEMAHAYLKVEEPGGRYTEADMERALEVVGGDLTQPDAIVDRWQRKLAAGMEGLEDYRLQYDPELWSTVITPEGEQRVQDEYARWQERAAVPFGRASQKTPRPGAAAAPAAPGGYAVGEVIQLAPGVTMQKVSD